MGRAGFGTAEPTEQPKDVPMEQPKASGPPKRFMNSNKPSDGAGMNFRGQGPPPKQDA